MPPGHSEKQNGVLERVTIEGTNLTTEASIAIKLSIAIIVIDVIDLTISAYLPYHERAKGGSL
jgi:hypothetical protein